MFVAKQKIYRMFNIFQGSKQLQKAMKSLHRLQIYGVTEQKHINWLYMVNIFPNWKKLEKTTGATRSIANIDGN
jgi:hypothetical protein